MEKKTDYSKQAILVVLLFLGVSLFSFLGAVTISIDVLSANNTSVKTFVNVTNTEPQVSGIVITPYPSIDLSPGNITTVVCNATVWDYNGWNDIHVLNGTLFYSQLGFTADSPEDNNSHYRNNSCEVCKLFDTATNASCACSFPVQYYADNGTWSCNVSVRDRNIWLPTDTPLNFTASAVRSVNITPLIALDVPGSINYGNLTVTQTSSSKTINITNLGNRNINTTVYGYGGDNSTDGFNLSMRCPLGNITIDNERYSFEEGNPAFATMTRVNSSEQATGSVIQRITDERATKNSTNSTYWKLNVPLTVGGFCNGTLVFVASDSLVQ